MTRDTDTRLVTRPCGLEGSTPHTFSLSTSVPGRWGPKAFLGSRHPRASVSRTETGQRALWQRGVGLSPHTGLALRFENRGHLADKCAAEHPGPRVSRVAGQDHVVSLPSQSSNRFLWQLRQAPQNPQRRATRAHDLAARGSEPEGLAGYRRGAGWRVPPQPWGTAWLGHPRQAAVALPPHPSPTEGWLRCH